MFRQRCVMPLEIETQKVFLNAVRTGEFAVANALLAADQSDSNLRVSEDFPRDRASRLNLARFIVQGQFTETAQQHFSERLFEKTDGTEEQPPLNDLELLVLEGVHDAARAALMLAPGLKISEAFPKDNVSLGCLWRFVLDQYAGLSEPLKQEVPKLLNWCTASDDSHYQAFNYFLLCNNTNHCLEILNHAPEGLFQPYIPAHEKVMHRALLSIIQAQLAKRGLAATEESRLELTLKYIMGPEHLFRTDTLRGFIMVLIKERTHLNHFDQFFDLLSRIAAVEDKKAVIASSTANNDLFEPIQYTLRDRSGQQFTVYDTSGSYSRARCADLLVKSEFFAMISTIPAIMISTSICMLVGLEDVDLVLDIGGLIILILLTLGVCAYFGANISMRSANHQQFQVLDSRIEAYRLELDQTKKELAQQVTEAVEKPKLYQAYQRLAFMLMGGRNHHPVQIDDGIDQSVGKQLVDQLSQKPLPAQAQMEHFESELQAKIAQQHA